MTRRYGRTIAGDKTDEWLRQLLFYRPVNGNVPRTKKDALMVSFMAGTASSVLCLPGKMRIQRCWSLGLHQKLHIEGRICGLSPRMRLHPAKGRPRLLQNPLPDALGSNIRQPPSPDGKPVTSLQPLIESFTHPNAIVLDPLCETQHNGLENNGEVRPALTCPDRSHHRTTPDLARSRRTAR